MQESIPVQWKVATDPELSNVVQSGETAALAVKDFTVKVDVTGLEAGTTYYYGFSALGGYSLTGRTKTTSTGMAEHLKFAVLNCANFQTGYFSAYRNVAAINDLDAVIYLGDYFYEAPDGAFGNSELVTNRPIEPKNELVSLDDYRLRYSTYRLDTCLVRLHQQHPFIPIWDDHEFANNAWVGGASNHDPATEGDWEDRKSAAKLAYFEWMPIRESANQQIFRSFQFGDLVDLFMLDTRVEGRQEQVVSVLDTLLESPERTLLGAAQKNWLKEELQMSSAKWKIIGNQVIFSKFNTGWLTLLVPQQNYFDFESLFLDSWQGYPAERQEIFKFISDEDIKNVVFATGDIHVAVGFEVAEMPNTVELVDTGGLQMIPLYSPSDSYDPESGKGALAVEFVSPSITTPNFDEIFGALAASLVQNLLNQELTVSGINAGNPNPHIKYADLIRHGYYLLDVKPDSVQANWYYNPILLPEQEMTFDQAWYTLDGENRLRQASEASQPKAIQDIPAPPEPPLFTSLPEEPELPETISFFGIYPNPFRNQARLHYGLQSAEPLSIKVFNAGGKLVRQLSQKKQAAGIYTLPIDMNGLPEGMYFFQLETVSGTATIKGLQVVR